MPRLINQLEIEKCPHCFVDKPNLQGVSSFESVSFDGRDRRFWRVYTCKRCGVAVTACAGKDADAVTQIYPKILNIDENIPEPAKNYLNQALNSLNAPAGSVMLSASAVDAMLKVKGYREGRLYTRIDKAKDDLVITEDMARWAHEVRLDANEPRHADEESPLPDSADARKCVDFVIALGEFLFVLPARVKRGIEDASG